MNFATVDFMALVQGHQFSMNHRTVCVIYLPEKVVSKRWSSYSQDKVSSLVPEQVQLSPKR